MESSRNEDVTLHSSNETRPQVAWEGAAHPLSGCRGGWGKAAAIIVIAIAVVLAAYQSMVGEVVHSWLAHPLYGHGILVVPAVLYFIYQKRRFIAEKVPRPMLSGIFVMAGLSFLGVAAVAMSVEIIQQFTVVALLIGLVGSLVGMQVFSLLLFPLGLLFFAVPFGGDIVPILQDLTAVVTVGSLNVLGIPVYHEGRFIMVPGGSWEVADSCVGLQYIFPSLALGYVFAGTLFQQWIPRIVFMAAAFVMPILANFVRAVFIVLLALATDNRLGHGGDHYAYAWLIFGAMEFSLFLVGLRWRGRLQKEHASKEDTASSSEAVPASVPLGRMIVVAICGVSLAILPALLSAHGLPVNGSHQVSPTLPVLSDPWSLQKEYSGEWKPPSDGALGSAMGTFLSGEEEVHLNIAYYAIQREGDRLVNLWTPVVDRSKMLLLSVGRIPVDVQGEKVQVAESVVMSTTGGSRYLVWSWYWIDGRLTAQPYYAKVLEGISRLHGRPRGAAIVVITRNRENRAEARKVLQNFLYAIVGFDDTLNRSFQE